MAAPVLAAAMAGASIILAGPASAFLARAQWPTRDPRSVLILWQAICLAAGLSMIGAGVVLAVSPLGGNLLSGLHRWIDNAWAGKPFVAISGLEIAEGTLAAIAATVLFGVLLRSMVLAVRRRRAHRMLLDLLTASRRSPRESPELEDLLGGVRILDHATAVAYTVPGWHSRVVLSAGLVDLLTRAELAAVIDHERAHVRSRHDLLVLPFQAWATALGALPGVRAARVSVAELTEMLADDYAARRSSPKVVATALARVALAGSPSFPVAGAESPAVTGTAVGRRVRRLQHPDPLPWWRSLAVYLLAAALLCVPTVALLVGWR